MTVVITDEALQKELENLTEKVRIHDKAGNFLGYFSPRQREEELLYQHADRTIDPEEIRRLLKEEKEGFSFEQVMQHIRSLENSENVVPDDCLVRVFREDRSGVKQ